LLLEPLVGVAFEAPGELVLVVAVSDRREIASQIVAIVSGERRIVDVAGQENLLTVGLHQGDHMMLVATGPAEARRIKLRLRLSRVIDLPLERDIPWRRSKGGVDLSGACNDPMELEGEERAVA
jgi:hypothetical protein